MKTQCVAYTLLLAVPLDIAASESLTGFLAYLEETHGGFIWRTVPSSVWLLQLVFYHILFQAHTRYYGVLIWEHLSACGSVLQMQKNMLGAWSFMVSWKTTAVGYCFHQAANIDCLWYLWYPLGLTSLDLSKTFDVSPVWVRRDEILLEKLKKYGVGCIVLSTLKL